MSNEKVVQIHTYKIMPGMECTSVEPCIPMAQALKMTWLFNSNGMPMGTHGRMQRFVAIGDWELGYLSVLRFCPFCGANMEIEFKDYAQWHDGPPAMHEVRLKEGTS